MSSAWTTGNHAPLLENGVAFFPRVLAPTNAARNELLIETFILHFPAWVGLLLAHTPRVVASAQPQQDPAR